MPYYAASYVPLVRESQVLRWNPNSQRKPAVIKLNDAFGLASVLKPGDHLWLMMGATNAAVAVAAFRKGVVVHQLSFPRVSAWLTSNGTEPERELEGADEEPAGRQTKIRPSQVLRASQEAPQLFYSMSIGQTEALEIAAVLQQVLGTMEKRKAAANMLRTRLQYDAVIYGKVQGIEIPSDPKEVKSVLEALLADLLKTKDKQGRRRTPSDPHIAFLAKQEEEEHSQLETVCKNSAFFQHLFGNVESVGYMLGARFVTAIERIERFSRPEDLSNYAGMLPRGKEGRLPSRKRSKGQTLSRSPRLNTACFLLQDQMFQWGRNTELGQRLIQQVESTCPCTEEQRQKDKDLRRKHVEAVKLARIAMTRYFLEHIVWPRWREYMKSTTS